MSEARYLVPRDKYPPIRIKAWQCPNDTNGDGDCHLCARNSLGCHNIIGSPTGHLSIDREGLRHGK